MLKRNEFLWILVGKGFREKVEAQKISFKFQFKNSNLDPKHDFPFIIVE